MKIIGLMLLFIAFVACDPYGFGFKKNPAYVLNEGFTALQNNDLPSLLEVIGKEALCLYGNEKGIQYLKDNLDLNIDNLKMNPKVLTSKHHNSPQFVGFWSYYSERYQVEVLDQSTKEIPVKAIIDCNYGTDGAKEEKLIELNPKKYKVKECRLTKFMPVKFAPLPMTEKCLPLKVDL